VGNRFAARSGRVRGLQISEGVTVAALMAFVWGCIVGGIFIALALRIQIIDRRNRKHKNLIQEFRKWM
jgi:hypothetical protein